MRMPTYAAPAPDPTRRAMTSPTLQGLEPEGCNVFEWIGCAAAIAGCGALSGPALVACVAGVAPGCIKC